MQNNLLTIKYLYSLSTAHKIAPKSTKFRYKPAPEPAPEFAFRCGFSIRSAWLNAPLLVPNQATIDG
jgi:hypothetical protein